jgi:hypothetical protein
MNSAFSNLPQAFLAPENNQYQTVSKWHGTENVVSQRKPLSDQPLSASRVWAYQ